MTGEAKGRAAERTGLAWTRTSLAVLANGGLLLLRHVTGEFGPFEVLLVIGSGCIAALVVAFGRLRARQVRAGGAAPPGPGTTMVLTFGLSVAGFAVLVTVSLLTR